MPATAEKVDAFQSIQQHYDAAYPITYLKTYEETRAIEMLGHLDGVNSVWQWSTASGIDVLRGGVYAARPGADAAVIAPDASKVASLKACNDILKALAAIKAEGPPSSAFAFLDPHPFLKNAVLIRAIRDALPALKEARKVLYFVSPVQEVPVELSKEVTVIPIVLPTVDELRPVLARVAESAQVDLGEGDAEVLLEGARGLTVAEAENAFSLAAIRTGALGREAALIVQMEKASALSKDGLLTLAQPRPRGHLAGMGRFVRFVEEMKSSFGPRARAYGLPVPRGTLLAGMPGCGKSLGAKVASSILGNPLLRWDIARSLGSLMGQSEQNTARVFEIAEAIGNCTLWSDEIEKGVSGSTGTGQGDGGTIRRVVGQILTWTSEKTCPVFLYATANGVRGVPNELYRKGRLDEVFWVGLPTFRERMEHFKTQIAQRGRDAKSFNLSELAMASDSFSGSEIEAALVVGMRRAFNDGEREFTTEDIVEAARETVPHAKLAADELREVQDWAAKNGVKNASDDDGRVGATTPVAVPAGRGVRMPVAKGGKR